MMYYVADEEQSTQAKIQIKIFRKTNKAKMTRS